MSYLDIGFLDSNAEPLNSNALEQNPAVVISLIENMQHKYLDIESMVLLKETAHNSIGLIRDLVPVAAQLSAAHMRWWIAISDSMRQLNKSLSREDVEKNIIMILKNIQEFDTLGY